MALAKALYACCMLVCFSGTISSFWDLQFVNRLVTDSHDEVPVGGFLHSCTSQLTPIALDPGQFTAMHRFGDSRRLVIVDTPGFDDTYVDDVEILTRISDWLATS